MSATLRSLILAIFAAIFDWPCLGCVVYSGLTDVFALCSDWLIALFAAVICSTISLQALQFSPARNAADITSSVSSFKRNFTKKIVLEQLIKQCYLNKVASVNDYRLRIPGVTNTIL